MDGQQSHKSNGIQVISRAADILRLLGKETGGLSLRQIAVRVNLPHSTVQRIVSSLSAEGFISTEKGFGGIRLGPEIQSLAQATASDLKDRLRPIMKRICEETGETVDLSILECNRMLFIDQIVGSQRLRTVSSIGASFPLTTTANGKAALACMDRAAAVELIKTELETRHHSSKSFADLTDEIGQIRNGAFARDENEHTDGICALGFAIKDQSGDIFALSTPVPSSRYQRVKDSLARALHESRAEIEAW